MISIKVFELPKKVCGIKFILNGNKTILIINKKLISKFNDVMKKNLLDDLSNVDMINLKGFSIGFIFEGGGFNDRWIIKRS